MNQKYYKLFRLYVNSLIIKNNEILLNNKQWHYIRNVICISNYNYIIIFNGINGEWLSMVIFKNKKNILLKPIKQIKKQSNQFSLTYAFAPLKKGRIDYMIQKATELGVGLLQPILTDHTINRKVNIKKLIANSIEAAEQCSILNIPKINQPINFSFFINNFGINYKIIFCDERIESESPIKIIKKLKFKKICVLIGPEGGFSKKEYNILLKTNNVLPISLGPRIIRADTAAVVALTLIQATIGDW